MTTRNTGMNKTKKGGNIAKQMSDLAVPFGLILAKQSLESFLNKQKTMKDKSPKKSAKKPSSAKKTTKVVSLSGGAGCGASKASSPGEVEAYSSPKTQLASVGGSSVKKTKRGGSNNAAKAPKA